MKLNGHVDAEHIHPNISNHPVDQYNKPNTGVQYLASESHLLETLTKGQT
jgi:hypothetical protein